MIIVGIPAFNEEKSIARVIVLAMKYADRVVVCDDGSTDLTGEIARSMKAEVIRHARNMGKGEALRSLFIDAESANPDVFVTIDADGQHDPDEIPKLVELVKQGSDVVVGSRRLGDIPALRRVGNDILTRSTATGVSDTQSGFRAYNGHRLGDLIPAEMGMGVDAEILGMARQKGMKIVEVPISVSYEDNTPTYNPVFHGTDVMLSIVKRISIRHPLMFYGIPGGISLLVALVFWGWTLSAYAVDKTIVTNVALVAVGATMIGLILLAIAVILWVLISVVRERRW